jgi:AmmeMemoRadiSam system protein B
VDETFPKLRPVEAIGVQENQICLRDPEGISDKLVFLSPDLFFIVSLFDGVHSILDIQTAYTRKYGNLLFSDKVREIIEQLDNCLLLESEHFRETRDRLIEEYRKAPARPPSHAGMSYAGDREQLIVQLGKLFDDEELHPGESPQGKVRGLIAPHIDITRGGSCFAASYAALREGCEATTFVVLGISHAPTQRRFVLTEKDFETPLGVLPADRDFIESLTARLKTDCFQDELVHRREHSVEFQAVFLRYLNLDNPDLRIVPVLCGSFEQIYSGGSPAQQDDEFQEFSSALRDTLAQRGSQTCCIAGVDLSHLGRRFGQDLTMTKPFLEQAREDDMRMIQRITALDSEGFFRFIQDEKDRRNVCGVPAIYTLLSVIDAKKAQLLAYEQSVDSNTQSVVTFMGAAFYE